MGSICNANEEKDNNIYRAINESQHGETNRDSYSGSRLSKDENEKSYILKA